MLKKLALVLFAIGIAIIGMGIAPKRTTSATIPYVPHETENQILQSDPGEVERLYQEWLKQEQLNAKKQIGKFDPCSCVSYAKWKSGINVGSIGKAKNHPINSENPTVGGLVILNESSAGHLAVVTQIWANTIVITEANFSPCKVGTREIPRNDTEILGYYY